ncbi:serine/threonine-protein kinase [Chlorogloea sp. CCALA 695]|uniref:serine/threonine-protein kinase n=1 Tax=Chlorogloea sp. CCALA 695 TaxID=2107693 RepID=UPI000D0605D1|nr:serine/threonine-protein kinase [Chlorogloea sp. CCALA 695]PSB34183.1 serine/threonine protein kinase [Chlorogloea sp. CCALA 695]
MTYCLNPKCRHPENPIDRAKCESCGNDLVRLRDRYRVSQALAHGGFGATFLAQDEGLPGEPICVIKQLRLSVDDPNVFEMARDLFEREAKTLGKIGNHPQVPRLLDYFEEDNQFYLVQEYVNGPTLQQEVKRFGAFSEAGVKQFLSEILPIVQYIHDQRVIHRDIKPANLIRRVEDCKLVMIDFGAVKNEVNNTINSQSLHTTVTSYAVGTAGFAPPEQIALRPVYASDIYAVGVTCIYLLTAKAPKDFDYHPSTGEMLWEQKVRVSDSLAKVLKKMLEASVRHRYQSATEVLDAIELEPYEDSLASSMASNRKSLPNSDRSGFTDRSNPGEGYNPSIVQMATSIRERRVKSIESNPKSSVDVAQELKSKTWKSKITSSSIPLTKNLPVARINSHTLLSDYINGKRDFAMQNLSMLDLERADLTEVNFHGCKLHKTNLHKAILFNSDLGQASLNQASLKEANLSKAYLSHADLEGADLRGADLSNAYLNHANLRGANLSGANLTNAKVSEEQLAMAKTNWMTIRPNGKRSVL